MMDVHIPAPPSVARSYAGLLRPRSTPKRPSLPSQRWIVGPLRIDPGTVRRYRSCLGLTERDTVPTCFPHALAGRVHMHMFADARFPFSMAGAVHAHTRIEQFSPLPMDTPIQIGTWFAGVEGVETGADFTVATTIWAGGEVRWSSTNRFRVRGRFTLPAGEPPPTLALPDHALTDARWRLAPSLGRQYAAVCSDWNPIHLSTPSARIFGMRGAIAHGYANLAIALDRLFPAAGPGTVEAAFKGPAFLGREVVGHADANGRFALHTADDTRPCVVGTVRER